MLAEAEVAEYLTQIRTDVCSRCPERPAGGPPCAPLGKQCGVELHLPQLIASIQEVNSSLGGPYLEHNRKQICESCAFLHSSICPCPMDYLAVLLVGAVEAVDERHERLGRRDSPGRGFPENRESWLGEIARAYDEAIGTWTGCDWPTQFGRMGLDLNGCTAATAAARAGETAGLAAEDWAGAAKWLRDVESYAGGAEAQAAMAFQAVRAGQWREALEHAERAWALEFATGRPIWHSYPPAWQRVFQAVQAACLGHPPRAA